MFPEQAVVPNKQYSQQEAQDDQQDVCWEVQIGY